MKVLGIETSCDETAIGIVDGGRRILANRVASQFERHADYGGVVPEIAARAHLEHVQPLLRQALDEAKLSLREIDGIAATCGPGLIGGVMVGAMTGKALAAALNKPFIAVNHLEAHALTARLTDEARFPYLLLLVSGGHCQLVLVRGIGDYRRLGTTIDDAVGECFDKGAKLLGLPQPGGPAIEQAAKRGDAGRYPLPKPLTNRSGCDFSFSGLKTALRLLVEKQPDPDAARFTADAAASLQATIAAILADRTRNAFGMLAAENRPVTALVVAGGVAANRFIHAELAVVAAQAGVGFHAPPPALCTDNGVMIAWAGVERLRLGLADPLDAPSRPRWPLDEMAASVV